MQETLISFELAKAAKDKGFKTAYEFYKLDGTLEEFGMVGGYSDCHDKNYAAPTQSLLAKWLREEHNVFVTVTNQINVADDEKATESILFDWEIKYLSSDTNKFEEEVNYFEWFNTYEEALEDALGEALNYIADE